MPNPEELQTKESNYNRSCDCGKCKNLIEKGSQFYFLIGKREKYSIHPDCYTEFISRFKPKSSGS
jgi:hypothetical protein